MRRWQGLVAGLFLAGTAEAQTSTVNLLSENFTSGLDGWLAVNHLAGVAPAVSTDATPPFSGQVLHFAGSSANSLVLKPFPACTLSRPGDWVQIQASVRYAAFPGGSSGFTLGLYNANGTPLAANSFSSPGATADDLGYKATKYTNASANDIRIYGEANPSGTFPFYTYTGTVLQTTNSGAAWANTAAVHTAVLRLTLAANGTDLQVTATYDGVANTVTILAASVLTRTFNEAVILPSGDETGCTANVGNITVSAPFMAWTYESANDLAGWGVHVDGVGSIPNAGSNPYLTANRVAVSPTVSIGAGSQSLRLQLGAGSPTGGSRYWLSGVYAINPAVSRRIQVSFLARTQGIAPGDVSVMFLEQSDTAAPAWIQGGLNLENPGTAAPVDFVRVVPTPNWHAYSKIGELRDTTARLYAYVFVKNNADTTGIVDLDDFVVTQVPDDGSYLVEGYTGSQGNVTDDGEAVPTFWAYCYDRRPPQGSVSIQVKSETGALLGAASFTGPIGSVALPSPGYAQVQVAGAAASPTLAFTNTFTAARVPAAVSPDSPFGMMSANTANPLALRGGANWNRFFLLTEGLYPSATNHNLFTWAAGQNAEAPYLDGNDYGFLPDGPRWIAVLRGVRPEMANTGGGAYVSGKLYPPTDWAWFQNYVKFIVSGLPASVECLEVANEPEYNWAGSVADLALYFQNVHQAVQAVRPSLKVLGPTLAHFDSPTYPDGSAYSAWLQPLLAAGLLGNVDAIAMHGYVAGPSGPSAPEGEFYDRIVKFNTVVASYGGASLPTYMTEFGWLTAPGDWLTPIPESTRANYASRALILSRVLGLSEVGLFCLKNIESSGSLDTFSILAADDAPTPTYAACAATAAALMDAAAAGPYADLGDGSGKHALFQNGDGSSVLCLWNIGAASTVRLPSSAGLTATDMMGRPLSITGGTLALGPAPAFLRAPGGFFYTLGAPMSVAVGQPVATGVQDYLALGSFGYNAATQTLAAPAAAGTYFAAWKSGGTWVSHLVTVH